MNTKCENCLNMISDYENNVRSKFRSMSFNS